jgi:hypothetical protein
MSDPMRFEFNAAGELELNGRDHEPWEANCAVCGEPIRWVLDMFSFTTHPHRLAHARCAWTKEAFATQRALAPSGEDQ